VSKQQALKVFKKTKPTESLLNEMLKALDRQKLSSQWTKNNGQYIPYPATWLNGERWKDEPVPVASGEPIPPMPLLPTRERLQRENEIARQKLQAARGKAQ